MDAEFDSLIASQIFFLFIFDINDNIKEFWFLSLLHFFSNSFLRLLFDFPLAFTLLGVITFVCFAGMLLIITWFLCFHKCGVFFAFFSKIISNFFGISFHILNFFLTENYFLNIQWNNHVDLTSLISFFKDFRKLSLFSL